jgi:hypothetical protein
LARLDADGLDADGLAPEGLAPEGLAPEGLDADGRAVVLDRGDAERSVGAAVAGRDV